MLWCLLRLCTIALESVVLGGLAGFNDGGIQAASEKSTFLSPQALCGFLFCITDIFIQFLFDWFYYLWSV